MDWETYSIISRASAVVLDQDQRMAGLLQDGHKLKDREASADLQLREPAAQMGEDPGVVAGDVQQFESLQVLVAVQGLDEHFPWARKVDR
jgi:hypothetical protein